jgi:hypothetical protein
MHMLVRFVVASILATVLFCSPASAAGRERPALFPTEVAADKHCPHDEVVWLNIASGVYHERGMRWYGKTKHGAFVCKKEADEAGDRDTRNGQ